MTLNRVNSEAQRSEAEQAVIEPALADFLAELNRKNILLWVEGDSLRYKAPKGEMTSAIMSFLKERKTELIQNLRDSRPAPESADAIFYDPIPAAPVQPTGTTPPTYPLSSAQKRMFVLNQLNPEQTGYNLTQVLKLQGPVQLERIQAVIDQIIDRHEILRTSFELVEGNLVQRIHPKLEFKVEFTETCAASSASAIFDGDAASGVNATINGGPDTAGGVEALIHQFVRPYDLKRPPLFRIRLVKLNRLKDTYLLLYDTHHIISDGVSLGVFTKEINDLYAGRVLPPLPVQYKDFTLWHEKLLKSDFLKAQKEHWLKKFRGEIPVINLPVDHQRPPVFQFDGGAVKQWITPERAAAINQLARKSQATLYQILFSVFYVLLARLTGQADLVVGTPTAGRRHADLYDVIGIFVNTLVIRAYPESGKRFRDFVVELSRELLTDFDNQDYPFENLVEELKIERDLSRNPLFDVMFILQNMKIDPVTAADLEVSPYQFQRKIAQFDLTLTASENEKGIELELNYASQIFLARTAQRFLEYYLNILECIALNPEVSLSDIEMVSERERKQLLYELNDTAANYPKHKTIQELFEEQVERTPERIAIIFEDRHACARELTYRELNEKANQLAGLIRERGIGSDSIVAIMVERSFEMIIGIMAILKAGGAYLPIAPTYPAERIQYMLEDSGSSILLTAGTFPEQLQFHGEVIELCDARLYQGATQNLAKISSSNHLAYVIYTSGSTGKPKGTMIEHYSVINRLNWMQ
ncbi:MAG TPA: condensation domain-containing protein, partial [Bacillota bacterium]|nr:condensation domain-containing protein [Bacillota bacterium]